MQAKKAVLRSASAANVSTKARCDNTKCRRDLNEKDRERKPLVCTRCSTTPMRFCSWSCLYLANHCRACLADSDVFLRGTTPLTPLSPRGFANADLPDNISSSDSYNTYPWFGWTQLMFLKMPPKVRYLAVQLHALTEESTLCEVFGNRLGQKVAFIWRTERGAKWWVENVGPLVDTPVFKRLQKYVPCYIEGENYKKIANLLTAPPRDNYCRRIFERLYRILSILYSSGISEDNYVQLILDVVSVKHINDVLPRIKSLMETFIPERMYSHYNAMEYYRNNQGQRGGGQSGSGSRRRRSSARHVRFRDDDPWGRPAMSDVRRSNLLGGAGHPAEEGYDTSETGSTHTDECGSGVESQPFVNEPPTKDVPEDGQTKVLEPCLKNASSLPDKLHLDTAPEIEPGTTPPFSPRRLSTEDLRRNEGIGEKQSAFTRRKQYMEKMKAGKGRKGSLSPKASRDTTSSFSKSDGDLYHSKTLVLTAGETSNLDIYPPDPSGPLTQIPRPVAKSASTERENKPFGSLKRFSPTVKSETKIGPIPTVKSETKIGPNSPRKPGNRVSTTAAAQRKVSESLYKNNRPNKPSQTSSRSSLRQPVEDGSGIKWNKDEWKINVDASDDEEDVTFHTARDMPSKSYNIAEVNTHIPLTIGRDRDLTMETDDDTYNTAASIQDELRVGLEAPNVVRAASFNEATETSEVLIADDTQEEMSSRNRPSPKASPIKDIAGGAPMLRDNSEVDLNSKHVASQTAWPMGEMSSFVMRSWFTYFTKCARAAGNSNQAAESANIVRSMDLEGIPYVPAIRNGVAKRRSRSLCSRCSEQEILDIDIRGETAGRNSVQSSICTDMELQISRKNVIDLKRRFKNPLLNNVVSIPRHVNRYNANIKKRILSVYELNQDKIMRASTCATILVGCMIATMGYVASHIHRQFLTSCMEPLHTGRMGLSEVGFLVQAFFSQTNWWREG